MARQTTQNVALPAIVDLDALDPLRDRLLDALDKGALSVDAAAVERVSTNAIFMLMSAAETAKRSNTDFAVDRPSAALLAAAARLGLQAQLAAITRG